MIRKIEDVAESIGFVESDYQIWGPEMAKIRAQPTKGAKRGRLVLVSAMTPTKAGEGKTTVSVGLSMGLNRIGKSCIAALREPSLGPVFGIKGGGTGGGKASLHPAERINLHFTGDMHAIAAAHNLLAALVDHELHFGDRLDPRRVTWSRVVDVNDRALRHVMTGMGGVLDGVPRQSRFDITAASEIMAILSLAESFDDLVLRLGRIIVGYSKKREPVCAADLDAHMAMAALLKDAMMPNLVQTSEGTPAIVHGGPFANIAHGCSSVVGTKVALEHADFVVTEAGFGFDLGGEKFLELKCRKSGLWPHAVVLVVTLKALAHHGGGESAADLVAIERGLAHLKQLFANVEAFGLHAVVAINAFPDDSEDGFHLVEAMCEANDVRAARYHGFADGGSGAEDLAKVVADVALLETGEPRFLYQLDDSIENKVAALATKLYGATHVEYSSSARLQMKRLMKAGYADLPICVAKTHLSPSDNPKKGGIVEEDFELQVSEVRLSAGAGFLVVLMGAISTMPGLPRDPAAKHVRFDGERILGLMQGD